VIAGDNGIEFAANGAAEDCVARERSLDVDPAAPRVMNCWAQDRFIL